MSDSRLEVLQERLLRLEAEKNLDAAKRVIQGVVGLLIPDADELDFRLFRDSDGKLTTKASWFYFDDEVVDRRATYTLRVPDEFNLDVKVFGITNPNAKTISWAVGLTPNFEDEPFNGRFNVGIDFIIPQSKDSVIVALSKNYVTRTMLLKGKLTSTFLGILDSWTSVKELHRKQETHSTLWNSLDLVPINKKFYEGISERFISLRQHLENVDSLNSQHAAQFANRLIGRVIFTWFLDKKGLLDADSNYFASVSFDDATVYYRERLEPLFFEVLNTPIGARNVLDVMTPYLNGGLFEPRPEDLYTTEKVTFPRNYFDDFFHFLRSYNFTTDESTGDFQQVAIDPEMLGRIFENLLAEISDETGEQARKAKGAFYTPREIVDFMCKETLKSYLRSRVRAGEDLEKRLAQLVDATERQFHDQDQNWRRDLKPYKDEILRALDELRIIDPACGSGAFPIGMMQLLTKLYERLEPRFDHHKAKLSIIEKNIYGVDIEPMAVEISRLRAWLALVVDEDTDPRVIKPLPNLDFKFVAADSLVPLQPVGQLSFFEDQDLDAKLQEIRDSYFKTENANQKVKLRNKYQSLVNEELTLFGESERTSQLKSFKPFESDSYADFFNSEQMFGIEKFDIVIGNPPYVSVKGIKPEMKSRYARTYFTGKGRFNLFTLFLERGQKLLSESGVLSYILPDSLFSHIEYRHAREYLVGHVTIQSVGLFSKRVFEAAVDTAIIQFQNGHSESELRVIKDLTEHLGSLTQDELSATENFLFPVLVHDEEKQVIRTVRDRANAVLDDFFDIQQGIIYSGQSKSDVFANDPLTPEFKRVLDGRDIQRWIINWDEKAENKYIKYTNDLHRPRDERLFLTTPKIVMPRKSTRLTCAVDEAQFYALNTAYVLRPKSEDVDCHFYAALLNSHVMGYFYSRLYFGWQITIPALKSLPIPAVDKEIMDEVAGISRRLHGIKTNVEPKDVDALEERLNALIFQTFGFQGDLVALIAQKG